MKLEVLERRQVLSAAPLQFDLLSDVNIADDDSVPFQAGDQSIEFKGMTYLATDSDLWRIDSVRLELELFYKLSDYSSRAELDSFTVVGDRLYFTANTNVSGFAFGNELWVTDGTVSGTRMVADINPGNRNSDPSSLVEYQGQLYFSADDGQSGREIWRTTPDGGVELFVDTSPGVSYWQVDVRDLTVVGDVLFFVAARPESSNVAQLWRSDGTTDGTRSVDSSEACMTLSPVGLAAWGDNLIYARHGSIVIIDPVSETATLQAQHAQGPRSFHVFGDSVLWASRDSDGQDALWRLDTPNSSPVMVLPDAIRIEYAEVVGGSLFVETYNGYSYSVHYIATPASPLTEVFRHKIAGSVYRLGSSFFLSESWVYRIDQSPSGLAAIVPGIDRGSIIGYLGDQLLVTAEVANHGRELFLFNGDDAGLVQLTDFVEDTEGSYPYDFVELNGDLFFLARDESERPKLWRSDASGTHAVFGPDDDPTRYVVSLTRFGDELLLKTRSNTNEELYRSDGTSEGTSLIKKLLDPIQGIAFSRPAFFTHAGAIVYFRALPQEGTNSGLWRTDGTAEGTFAVTPLEGVEVPLSSRAEVVVGDTLYFYGYTDRDGEGYELWRTDGVIASQVKDINPGWSSSKLVGDSVVDHGTQIAVVPSGSQAGRLVFFADDGVHGSSLWISDGSESGTSRIADFDFSSSGSLIRMVVLNDYVYFSASEGGLAGRLWRTDGTSEGTSIVGGSEFLRPSVPTVVGNTLFFSAQGSNGSINRDLWRLGPNDLTAHRFIGPLPTSDYRGFSPGHLTNLNGVLYFVADDGVHGWELWRVPDEFGEPELVADIRQGIDGSSPAFVTLWGDSVVVSAIHESFGREPWIGTPHLPGDYNGDGVVENEDYLLWRSTYGSTSDLSGDGNRNGRVDAADYSIWRDNLGRVISVPQAFDYDGNSSAESSSHALWESESIQENIAIAGKGDPNGVAEAAVYTIWPYNLERLGSWMPRMSFGGGSFKFGGNRAASIPEILVATVTTGVAHQGPREIFTTMRFRDRLVSPSDAMRPQASDEPIQKKYGDNAIKLRTGLMLRSAEDGPWMALQSAVEHSADARDNLFDQVFEWLGAKTKTHSTTQRSNCSIGD